jgi:sugar (pentulose or hexulose) kinase
MVFDHNGAIAGSAYIEYDLMFTPRGVEQDGELWWNHTKDALREAVRAAGIDGRELAALGISSQGIASVPVDGDGRPLAPAISWYDTRADGEAAELAAFYGGQRLFEITGRHPGSLFFPQVLFIKRRQPELYEKTSYFLMAHDYLCFRLCGEALTDYTLASGTLCFDTARHEWIKEIFDHFGVDLSKFPRLKPFGERAGRILPEVARELGLAGDTVVAVGMQDQKAAALAAGIAPGIRTLSLGTASAVSLLTGERIRDPSGRAPCHAFDGGSWILENTVGASGAALKWLRNTLFPGVPYPALDEMAASSGAGAGGLVFYPGLDRGKGCFSGISLNTGAGDMVRAVQEGVACAIRRCVETQRDVYPQAETARELRVFGGGAASGLWRRILADCLRLPVAALKTPEMANVGAAICAGMALGLFASGEERRRFAGGALEVTEPQETGAAIYDGVYAVYRALQEAVLQKGNDQGLGG